MSFGGSLSSNVRTMELNYGKKVFPLFEFTVRQVQPRMHLPRILSLHSSRFEVPHKTMHFKLQGNHSWQNALSYVALRSENSWQNQIYEHEQRSSSKFATYAGGGAT